MEKTDKNLIHNILQLNLEMRLICDETRAFPLIIKGKRGDDGYLVAIELGEKDIRQFQLIELEVKGCVDVEYLKFRGEVEIKNAPNEPGVYIMRNIRLEKHNGRGYRRVPYRRLIEIEEPIKSEATLVNFSASGALINAPVSIGEDTFKFSLLLNKRNILLQARVVEEKFDETINEYVIRCEFININEKTRRLLVLAVRQIVLQAKERLQKKK